MEPYMLNWSIWMGLSDDCIHVMSFFDDLWLFKCRLMGLPLKRQGKIELSIVYVPGENWQILTFSALIS